VSEADYLASFHEDPLYLNHASYGPPSQNVVETSHRLLGQASIGGPDASARLHSEDQRATAAISRLVGTPAERIALTGSTSLGLMQVAFGVTGGDVLLSRDEFPANVYPWLRARDAGLLGVRSLPSGDGPLRVTPELVADALASRTADPDAPGRDIVAVSVSAVDFRTGFVADLAGIRSVIGDRLLIVDGIQGFGVADLDWSSADALVVGGQKWLRAGWGAAFLAFSERGADRIRPTLGGWTGVEAPTRYDALEHHPLAGAAAHSITNLSPFATGSLATALELVESVGVTAIARRIADTAELLIAALDRAGIGVLSPHDREQRAGIVVAEIPDARAAVAHERLAAAGVTSTLHGTDRIRLSVHATTTPRAIELAAAVLGEFS
jgi:selenocysteine lyase/cysteine desulfurase